MTPLILNALLTSAMAGLVCGLPFLSSLSSPHLRTRAALAFVRSASGRRPRPGAAN